MDSKIIWCRSHLQHYLQIVLDNLMTIEDMNHLDKLSQKHIQASLQVLEHFFAAIEYPNLSSFFQRLTVHFSAFKQSIEPEILQIYQTGLSAFSASLGEKIFPTHVTSIEELIKNLSLELDWPALESELKRMDSDNQLLLDPASLSAWDELHTQVAILFESLIGKDYTVSRDKQAWQDVLIQLQTVAEKTQHTPIISILQQMQSSLTNMTGSSQDVFVPLENALYTLLWVVEEVVANRIDFSGELSGYQQLLAATSTPTTENTIETVAPVTPVTVNTIQRKDAPIEKTIDPELLNIFEEESAELLETIQESVETWRQLPEDNAPAQALKRDLHTLKGCARTIGVDVISHLVHALESFIVTLYESNQRPTADFFHSVQSGVDEIAKLLDQFKKQEVLQLNESLIACWQPMQSTQAPVSLQTEKSAQSIDLPPIVEEKAQSLITETTSNTSTSHKSSQEMVRIKAGEVEKLTQLATVANVSRSQLEKELTDMGEYVNDVIEGIEQLQSQLKLIQEEASPSGEEETMLARLARHAQETAKHVVQFQQSMAHSIENAENLVLEQQRVTRDLQEGLNRTQLVDFKTIVPRLERIVRQISAELNKEVRFDTSAASGDIDRRVLEHMTPALEHMLRNALDHGIESAEKRKQAHKEPIGTIRLAVTHVGGDFNLTLSDDGGGINTAAIRQKAIEKKLISPDVILSDEALFQMILQPGFSTAEKVSEISGRGVGMDVVHSEITQLGGSFEISSQLGQGTSFKIRLPFTRSLNRALLFGLKQSCFGITLTNIEGIVRIPFETFNTHRKDLDCPLEYNDKPYRLRYLGDLLSYDEAEKTSQFLPEIPVILLKSATPIAIAVDYLIGAKEIVIKSAGLQLKAIQEISGATLLPDGNIILILEPRALVERVLNLHQPASSRLQSSSSSERKSLVLIVDDSMMQRKTTEDLLISQGYTTVQAQDGQVAMAWMEKHIPDVVLLDLEMPNMDGFGVLTAMRASQTLSKVPVIMITSQDSAPYQEKALALGANAFMGKPYDAPKLLATIADFLAQEPATHG